jgi:flagellar basal body-associated protein FliL
MVYEKKSKKIILVVLVSLFILCFSIGILYLPAYLSSKKLVRVYEDKTYVVDIYGKADWGVARPVYIYVYKNKKNIFRSASIFYIRDSGKITNFACYYDSIGEIIAVYQSDAPDRIIALMAPKRNFFFPSRKGDAQYYLKAKNIYFELKRNLNKDELHLDSLLNE